MSSSGMKRTVVLVSCIGMLVGSGLSAAYAGEITGTGRSLKVEGTEHLHGASECAFSGLNDDYWAPDPNDTTQDRVQTPKGARQIVGYACNPSGARG
jgi:hypothetical protein